MDSEPGRWAACLLSLTTLVDDVVVIAGPHAEAVRNTLGHLRLKVSTERVEEVVARSINEEWTALFLVTSPVIVPDQPFDRALRFLDEDMRVATVSFISNDANYLSYPDRNRPTGHTVDGRSEAAITALLRGSGHLEQMVPIPVPAGGGILLSTLVLRSIGGLDPACEDVPTTVVDFALRAVRRGFRNVLDPSTFLTRPLVHGGHPDPLTDARSAGFLHDRHPTFPSLYEHVRGSLSEPLADAIAVAAAVVRGLRVLVDGSCLGPYETGTQVSLLSLVSALCGHEGIREIAVGVRGLQVPGYARDVLAHPKVRLCSWDGGRFPDAPEVDLVHRPFQPDDAIPWDVWRRLGRRVVISIQDLIAYDNGEYHPNDQYWFAYRDSIRHGVGSADGVVAISNDTAKAIELARLPVPRERLFVVEIGTDHPTGAWTEEIPPVEILERDLITSDFILVMGASYAHKNRDIAIRAWQELRRRGHDLQLVLAGVAVPYGSTRNEEAIEASHGDWPITLADVNSAERNWLMRHARVMLYPTSAEGFGLIPFEAAEFGTPTVFVGFGPLRETLPVVPQWTVDWSAGSLADSTEQLLRDPDLARRQVQAIAKSGEQYTWQRAAGKLINDYMTVLAEPGRSV